jgi:hypothetical protein
LQEPRFPDLVSAQLPFDANDPVGLAVNATEPVGRAPAPASETIAWQLVAAIPGPRDGAQVTATRVAYNPEIVFPAELAAWIVSPL